MRNQLKEYRSHKKVEAVQIHRITEGQNGEVLINDFPMVLPVVVDQEYMDRHNPRLGGYYVLYEDGYHSFSPAEAFENGYSLIDQA